MHERGTNQSGNISTTISSHIISSTTISSHIIQTIHGSNSGEIDVRNRSRLIRDTTHPEREGYSNLDLTAPE